MNIPSSHLLRIGLWGLLCALLVGTQSACDDSFRAVATPKVALRPDNGFAFSKLQMNPENEGRPTDWRMVEVHNEGNGELLIAKLSVEGLTDRDEFRLRYAITPNNAVALENIGYDYGGTDQFKYPIRVAPEASFYLFLDYSPKDESSRAGARGRIRMETNEGVRANVDLPVTVSAVGAELLVSPQALSFNRVAAGSSEGLDLVLTNIGSADLHIEQMTIDGSLDFTPLINGRDPRRDPQTVLADPDGDGRPGLAPGRSFTMRVVYAPEYEGPDTGALVITSNDVTRPNITVPLIANADTPCLRTQPPALEYPTSLINRTDTRILALESCGGAEVEVTAVYLSDDSDPAFSLATDELPSLPFAMPAVREGIIPSPQHMGVTFSPREQRIYNGKVIIESTDPVNPRREVNLLGRGLLNACPQARATQDEYHIRPLDVVVLDGSLSIDQDGPNNAPVAYEWVLISSPAGSMSYPVERFYDPASPLNGGTQDDPATPTARFLADLAGTYVFELRVTDNLGLDSVACRNPARVVVVAIPEQAIHLQLTWHAPDDPDPTDHSGPDLDLHLLHPRANAWFTAPWDCYYGTPTPDWGQPGSPFDDPVIDMDSMSGASPENINLNEPEDTDRLGAPYLVGVHYYRSTDRVTGEEFGPAIARLRIFIEGELSWDFTEGGRSGEKTMEGEDHFWDAAQIEWPARTVTTRDRYYTTRP